MPDYLARCLTTWRIFHPDWEFTLWTPEKLPELRHQVYFDDPRRWSPQSHPGQYRANLARYELLYDLGGVWVDCDLQCLRPIHTLLAGVTCFAAWEKQNRWINNAFIGCTPGHPAMAAVLDGIPASIESQPGKRSNWQTGARYITPILETRRDVRIFDQPLIYPYSYRELERGGEEFPNAYAVHHWANARRQRQFEVPLV
jgi:mannosyltransferase OCH1-like enzyme